jgi:hypothetical protein
MKKPILLDIMSGGRFVCQLRYTKRGFPQLVDGTIKEVYDFEDIQSFVYQQRPSLRNKSIRIEFSQNRV